MVLSLFYQDLSSPPLILSGFILSVTTEVCGLSCEFINIYLHPDQMVRLAQTLLRHLQTPPSREHHIRIIGGDFNQLQSKSLLLFESILTELDTTAPPFHPSNRKTDGYVSSLDFFLLQLPPSCKHLLRSKSFCFWPSYQPTRHGSIPLLLYISNPSPAHFFHSHIPPCSSLKLPFDTGGACNVLSPLPPLHLITIISYLKHSPLPNLSRFTSQPPPGLG